MIFHKRLPTQESWELLLHDPHGLSSIGEDIPIETRDKIYRNLLGSGIMDIYVPVEGILFTLTRITKWIVRLDTVTKEGTSPFELNKGYLELIEYLKTTEYVKLETRTSNKKFAFTFAKRMKCQIEGTHMNCDNKGTTEYTLGLVLKGEQTCQ